VKEAGSSQVSRKSIGYKLEMKPHTCKSHERKYKKMGKGKKIINREVKVKSKIKVMRRV
jgi:hypothetical protein